MWTIQGHAAFENAQGRGGRQWRVVLKGDARFSKVGWAIAIFQRLKALDA